MAGSFCILNLHFCAFLFLCCFKIPSASLEGIKNLEKPRKTLHTPKKIGKYPKKTCRNSVFVSSFNVFFACFAFFAIFVAFVLHVFRIFFVLQFSCIFPAFPEVLLGNGKFAKKSAKKKVNKLKKHAKKSRFHDSEKYAANPMQKNADEKRKSTPNIKSLQKKQIGHANLFQKNVKTIHFQHPSLYQTISQY
jgi:hypothetical protein